MFKKLVVICAVIIAVSGDYEEEQESYEPKPYDFGYEVKDEHGHQYRKEKSDGQGRVEGSYGFIDDNGIYREVYYVADKENGFRAEIKTNEPGTKTEDSADVKVYSAAKYQGGEGLEEYQGGEGNQDYDNNNYDNNEYRNAESVVMLKKQREHGGHV